MPAEIYFLVGEDGSDKQSRLPIPFPSTITMTDAQELVTALVTILDPLLNGGIKGAGVSFELSVGSGLPTITNALADLRDKARFSFIASGAAGVFPKILRLPTYDESYTLPGTKELDLTDPDVDAFVDAIVGGIAVTSGTIQPVDSRDYAITGLNYAVEE